ncbi:MAG: hypothetical protein ACXVA2_23865 [Mucilaginibacter sp.]
MPRKIDLTRAYSLDSKVKPVMAGRAGIRIPSLEKGNDSLKRRKGE